MLNYHRRRSKHIFCIKISVMTFLESERDYRSIRSYKGLNFRDGCLTFAVPLRRDLCSSSPNISSVNLAICLWNYNSPSCIYLFIYLFINYRHPFSPSVMASKPWGWLPCSRVPQLWFFSVIESHCRWASPTVRFSRSGSPGSRSVVILLLWCFWGRCKAEQIIEQKDRFDHILSEKTNPEAPQCQEAEIYMSHVYIKIYKGKQATPIKKHAAVFILKETCGINCTCVVLHDFM